MDATYAKVILSISHKDVDKAFHYAIPEHLKYSLSVGSSVCVPFGKGNKLNEAFVIGFSNEIDFDASKVKTIVSLNDEKPFFSLELLELALWMQKKYYTTLFSCLKCIMPSGMKFVNDAIVSILDDYEDKLEGRKLNIKQTNIILFLKANDGKVLQSEIENEFGGTSELILKTLENLEVAKISDISEFKNLTLKMKFAYVNYENESLDDAVLNLNKKQSHGARIMEMLMETESVSLSDLKKFLNVTNAHIQTLAKNNLIKIETVDVYRNTVNYNKAEHIPMPILTNDQQSALEFIANKRDLKPVLIHGITGSGKTEIYMNLIQKTIDEGKQAIMLVPEISLTPQTVSVFLNRFGAQVSVTHSRLTLGERFDQWKKARDGDTSIMIGPRSAIFTPFTNLGVIIIDEEHEKTYKSETAPKYSSKEVAIQRGKLANALVVLGSATPSVESYYECENKEIDLITITERINKTLPEISIVDMRTELEEGNMSIFSRQLHAAIEENLQKKEQTILFLNRRGFSTFVSCRKCGYVMKCDSCNVSYTYHIYSDKLMCHYCGKKEKNPKNCPQCGSKFIKHFGVGTQKIEDEVKRLFPTAITARMDADTTTGKHAHERILNDFRQGNANILIGTQMIAKGLDFPLVTVVGIVAADLSLNSGDFRSGETTYQLLTQVSGRAGRAAISGRVFVQTYNPDHYSILYAKDNDYEQFYIHEMSLRKQMIYPPYSHFFTVLVTSVDEKKVIVTLFKLLEIMNRFNKNQQFEMLGPSPATVSKIRKKYRWKLIIKCVDEEKLKNFAIYCYERLKESEDVSGLVFNLTLDPVLIV